MEHFIKDFLLRFGIDSFYASIINEVIIFAGIILLSIIANMIAKKILVSLLHKIASSTKTKWDDMLVNQKVFNKLSHLAPAVVLYMLFPLILADWPLVQSFVIGATKIYMLLVFVWVLYSVLTALLNIYRTFEISKKKPIKGYVQVVKIFIGGVALIIVVSIVIGRSPNALLGGLGALTAVLMLIFKDTILGFVAGVQLSANDMVRPGDWISMPKYGADGDVIEINLTTVKVKNWDKTITTVPTYALISDAFQNWRGMRDSGGRRIKRAMNIDLHSIKFLKHKDITKLSKIVLLQQYLKDKEDELNADNKKHGFDPNTPNGRHQTNIGVFRKYLELYLRNRSDLRQDMTFIVRQLEPKETGLPIQVYVFTNTIAWVEYEAIQSDIFDHILAIIPEFDLKAFQYSTDIY